MKAISLLQPYAELIIIGAKKIETRSRNTSMRGPVLIHASLGKYYNADNMKISCRELCYNQPFKKFIGGGKGYDALTFGAIVGMVTVVNTIAFDDTPYKSEGAKVGTSGLEWIFTEEELDFGDYSPGRYGYLLTNHIKFKTPISAKGKQMIPWQLDERLIPQILEQIELSRVS